MDSKSHELMPALDLSLSVASTCKVAGVNGCCKQIIAESIEYAQNEHTDHVAQAVLTFTCEGPNQEGCQAAITGRLEDNKGGLVALVDTTAAELKAHGEVEQ